MVYNQNQHLQIKTENNYICETSRQNNISKDKQNKANQNITYVASMDSSMYAIRSKYLFSLLAQRGKGNRRFYIKTEQNVESSFVFFFRFNRQNRIQSEL